MALVTPPPLTSALVDSSGVMTPAWAQWITQVYGIAFAAQQAGLTAERPTKGLYPGRFYFDKSLGAQGKPVWIRKDGTANWVLADGTAA